MLRRAGFRRNWPYMYALAFEQGQSNIKTDQVGATPPPADEGNENFGSLGGWRFYPNAA